MRMSEKFPHLTFRSIRGGEGGEKVYEYWEGGKKKKGKVEGIFLGLGGGVRCR